MSDVLTDWRTFLTDHGPGKRTRLQPAAWVEIHPICIQIHLPELSLHCSGKCNGKSFCNGTKVASGDLFGGLDLGEFEGIDDLMSYPEQFRLPHDVILLYKCEKCSRRVKAFCVRFWSVSPYGKDEPVDVEKISEWPPFAPPTPSKLISLIGPDRELFLKGRRAEIEGLGIGAFSYYRRIVETQKNRILAEIIRVARHVGAAEDAIGRLESAQQERQFSKAVESVKEAIPKALLISSHNPLTLLHSALSEGLHDESDENCLQAASDIRLILMELAEKMAEAMKEQKELDDALRRAEPIIESWDHHVVLQDSEFSVPDPSTARR